MFFSRVQQRNLITITGCLMPVKLADRVAKDSHKIVTMNGSAAGLSLIATMITITFLVLILRIQSFFVMNVSVRPESVSRTTA